MHPHARRAAGGEVQVRAFVRFQVLEQLVELGHGVTP
jgi:hypothetical protein